MGADASRAIEREGACIRARAQVEVGAALRQSLVRQVSIEHVLPALIVLHMHLAERAVQFLRRASQLLGYLGGGVARDGIEHIVGIVGLRRESLHITSQSQDVNSLLANEHILLLQLLAEHVAAVLSDQWQHLGGYPVGESLSRLLLGAEHQSVKTALIDKEHLHTLLGNSAIRLLASGYLWFNDFG